MFEQLNAANIVAFYEEDTKDREPYLGEILMPSQKQMGLRLDFIKGANGVPVALMPSEFDTDVVLRDRPAVEGMQFDMPFFKEARLLKERERQELLIAEQSGNRAYVDTLMRAVFNDRGDLIDGAKAQIERMRMQALSTGKISVKANKVNKTYDYGLPKENKVELMDTDKWSNPKSNPLGDIDKWVADMAGKGVELMILTTKTWGYIRNNDNVGEYIGKEVRRTTKNIKDYIKEEFGIDVVIYDKMFVTEQGTQKTFFPDDVVTLTPKKIGTTWFGTTPEEADLMAGVGTAADVELVDQGVAVTTITQEDPVNKITKVSEVVLPSFEGANNVFIANV